MAPWQMHCLLKISQLAQIRIGQNVFDCNQCLIQSLVTTCCDNCQVVEFGYLKYQLLVP